MIKLTEKNKECAAGFLILAVATYFVGGCLMDKWDSYKLSLQKEIPVIQTINFDNTINRCVQRGDEFFYSVISGKTVKSQQTTTQPGIELIVK
jgi:hypothetical protein